MQKVFLTKINGSVDLRFGCRAAALLLSYPFLSLSATSSIRPGSFLPPTLLLWYVVNLSDFQLITFETFALLSYRTFTWLSFSSLAANAAGEDLLPYFNDVMDHLKIYLISNSDTTPDFIKVCSELRNGPQIFFHLVFI